MKKEYGKDIYFFILFSAAFLLYASVFIYKTSFVIEGVRYFSLFDDAMISMRYARNLASGHGLVMNPGEFVEGITNPLWTLYMAVIHLLPVAQSKISLLIQITGAVLLVANLFVVMKIARLISDGSVYVSSGAMFLTAFYLPIINWSLQGMEVSLLTLMLSIAVWKALLCMKTDSFSLPLYILLGICTLVRIDMAVPFLGIWLFMMAVQPHHRKRNLYWGLSIFILFMSGQTLFRILYYGDALPNTYYLKMTGYPVLLRISRGIIVFIKFIWNLNPLLFFLPVILLVMDYSNPLGLLWWIFGLQCLYSMYVGGDAWEIFGGSNRYISVAMPLFFILFAHALFRTRNMIVSMLANTEGVPDKLNSLCVKYCFIIFLALSFIQFNNNKESLSLAGFVFLEKPVGVEGIEDMVETAIIVKKMSTPDASIAVTWAGALPYFSERHTIDILGKTDPVIAREKMRQASGLDKFTHFYPGHLKYDYKHSIGVMKPDIIVKFWGNIEEANPYVANKYMKLTVGDKYFFLRGESPDILWEELQVPQDY